MNPTACVVLWLTLIEAIDSDFTKALFHASEGSREESELGKAAFTAPLYISVAWSLIISYQIFTQTAVSSIVNFLDILWPSIGSVVTPRIDTIAFIHAFAWIFLLASVIPSIILGKGRSVLLQFLLCLTITLVAVSAEGLLIFMMGTVPTVQLRALTYFFDNPIIAGIYLSTPYVFMLYLDIRARKEKEVEEDLQEDLQETQVTSIEEVVQDDCEKNQVIAAAKTNPQRRMERMSFLYWASVACLVLALFTFLFGETLVSTMLASNKIVYAIMFAFFGFLLLSIGHFSRFEKTL